MALRCFAKGDGAEEGKLSFDGTYPDCGASERPSRLAKAVADRCRCAGAAMPIAETFRSPGGIAE
jgi:hypothetical protein